MRNRLLLSLCLLLLCAPARAQVAMNAQTFHPALGPDTGITVEGTRTPGLLRPAAGVLFEFAYRPLVLTSTTSGAQVANPVDTMTTAHLMGGLGLWRWLAVSFDLPAVLAQSATGQLPSSLGVAAPGASYLGDLRLVIKGRILDNQRGGLGLAFVPQFTFPTGSGTDFRGYSLAGASVYTIEPRLALDYRLRRGITIALNAGFQGRVCAGLGGSFNEDPGDASHACDQVLLNDRVSHLLTYGLGVTAPLPRGFALSGEVVGATSVASTDVGRRYAPLEGYLGARWAHRGGLTVTAGGGGAFLSAVGTPAFRFFAGVGYLPAGPRAKPAPPPPPPAPPPAPVCHERPVRPECPVCPPPPPRVEDRDGDGVNDDVDQCVGVAQGPHPDARRPGCPDVDTDGDGVYDSADPCPGEAPGLSPDPGRPGCPAPDRDRDAVPDAVDACPEQPGAPSADPKKHGCPGIVEVKGGMIVISQEIFFGKNKDVIKKKSYPVLRSVADTLQAMALIKKVAIEGHSDNKGSRDKNIELSDRRAQAVRRWLVEHGISGDRLTAKGYGPDRPIADNASKEGRAKNRRVEFRIVDPAKGPAERGSR